MKFRTYFKLLILLLTLAILSSCGSKNIYAKKINKHAVDCPTFNGSKGKKKIKSPFYN